MKSLDFRKLELQFKEDLERFLNTWETPEKFKKMLYEYVIDDFFKVMREEDIYTAEGGKKQNGK